MAAGCGTVGTAVGIGGTGVAVGGGTCGGDAAGVCVGGGMGAGGALAQPAINDAKTRAERALTGAGLPRGRRAVRPDNLVLEARADDTFHTAAT